MLDEPPEGRQTTLTTSAGAARDRARTRPGRLEHGHPFRQWKTWRMPGAGLTLTGYSRANDKTFFHIPELRCSLDAGLCEGRRVDTVFLTHTHLDHAKDLDFLAADPGGTDIHLPAESVPHAESYLRATAELNHGAAFDPTRATGHRLHGVRDGDEFTFGRRGHHVRVVACDHKVPCVGYAFAERVRRLRPEFDQLRQRIPAAEFGRVLARERAAGVEVDTEIRRPLFAYLGDTRETVFERNRWLFDYPVVITECTFLDEAQAERAERVGHTLWRRLRPIVEAHPQTLFVLIHFSLRHSDREVLAYFERQGQPPNVLVWAHPESHLPEQHQHGRSPAS
ncbi:ribonuclease Z [Micromonospora citrea]|uniref:Ribonuclease Z n=1 Tax=Micromonospora citrea TaxID=47855 RepID=A0A1C6V4S2_9ACTN|nr:MBL fold metallo-hydrolase [Micromonospora citrea]SCL61379.1 ribonuclease Z [Micromonospora citrea]